MEQEIKNHTVPFLYTLGGTSAWLYPCDFFLQISGQSVHLRVATKRVQRWTKNCYKVLSQYNLLPHKSLWNNISDTRSQKLDTKGLSVLLWIHFEKWLTVCHVGNVAHTLQCRELLLLWLGDHLTPPAALSRSWWKNKERSVCIRGLLLFHFNYSENERFPRRHEANAEPGALLNT